MIALALAWLVAIGAEILLYAMLAERAAASTTARTLSMLAMAAIVLALAAYTRYQRRHIGGHEKRTGERRTAERRTAESAGDPVE